MELASGTRPLAFEGHLRMQGKRPSSSKDEVSSWRSSLLRSVSSWSGKLTGSYLYPNQVVSGAAMRFWNMGVKTQFQSTYQHDFSNASKGFRGRALSASMLQKPSGGIITPFVGRPMTRAGTEASQLIIRQIQRRARFLADLKFKWRILIPPTFVAVQMRSTVWLEFLNQTWFMKRKLRDLGHLGDWWIYCLEHSQHVT